MVNFDGGLTLMAVHEIASEHESEHDGSKDHRKTAPIFGLFIACHVNHLPVEGWSADDAARGPWFAPMLTAKPHCSLLVPLAARGRQLSGLTSKRRDGAARTRTAWPYHGAYGCYGE
jgi:hypothetical protein